MKKLSLKSARRIPFPLFSISYGLISLLLLVTCSCDYTYNNKIIQLDWRKTIRQKSLNDCGVAVATMIFNHYSLHVTAEQINEMLPLKMNGVSMYDLKNFFERHHLEVEAIKCSPKRLKKKMFQ